MWEEGGTVRWGMGEVGNADTKIKKYVLDEKITDARLSFLSSFFLPFLLQSKKLHMKVSHTLLHILHM